MARALLAILVLMLAGCGQGDLTGPFAASQVPPSLSVRFYPPEGWTWGFVQTGSNPAQRYGVGSGWRAPRANIVIVPGYGESAEAWFETARGLIGHGYSIWILDRAGQGGSGRFTLPRDLGFVPSFDPDVSGLRSLINVVIKPSPGTPLILITQADGALVALRAVKSGVRVDGIVAGSPTLARSDLSPTAAGGLLGRVGLGRLPSSGWRPWSREYNPGLAQTHDPWRGKVQHAWQLANPDLRMAGPSLGWQAAYRGASRVVLLEAGSVAMPVVMIGNIAPNSSEVGLCKAMATCALIQVPGARQALHLETDRYRQVWLGKVNDVITSQVDAARAREIAPRP